MMTAVIRGNAASPSKPQQEERSPNKVALRITGRPYVSYSQLSLMRTCPKKFSFQYIEKTKPSFQPSSLIFGGSVHAMLEFYFRAKLEGLTVTPEALLSVFHDAWKKQREQAGEDVPVRFNKGEDENSVQLLAHRIIASFLDSSFSQPKGEILGVEEEMRMVIDPTLPDLLAKVDLVTVTDGALHVVDFKTAKSRWSEAKALEMGDQLLLYGTTVARMAAEVGVPVKLHFAVITKAKHPAVQLLPVPIDPARVMAVKDAVAQVWQAVVAGNFYPNPSPMNCTTCPFKYRCPVFGGSR